MRVSDTLQRFRKVTPFFLEVIEKGGMYLHREATMIKFICDLAKPLSIGALHVLKTSANSLADRIEIYVTGKMLSEGLKVFRPTQYQLETLEQMRVNVEFSDYVQPFPTVIIEFPENYVASKSIHCPQSGQWVYGGRIGPTHEPSYLVVRHEPEAGCILTSLMFTSDLSIKTSVVPYDGDTIEQYLEKINSSDRFENTLDVSNEEWAVVLECLRAALNYCLLVDEIGLYCQGPQNPAHHKRLQHFVQAGRQRGDSPERLAQARVDLLAHPQIYTLAQSVKLHRTVDRHEDLPSEGTGRKMPPHHRRGHWRMTPCGPGKTQRRRVRIPVVFVNSHLFCGKLSDTSATYEERR